MVSRTLLGEVIEGNPLTARELEVLVGMADGLTAAAHAAELFLEPETVKGYRKRVVAKLGARNGTHAVAIAFRRGLVANNVTRLDKHALLCHNG